MIYIINNIIYDTYQWTISKKRANEIISLLENHLVYPLIYEVIQHYRGPESVPIYVNEYILWNFIGDPYICAYLLRNREDGSEIIFDKMHLILQSNNESIQINNFINLTDIDDFEKYTIQPLYERVV